VANLGLLVILSGMGNNSITQTTHKTIHSTSLHMWSNCPGSIPVLCTVCDKKLGRSLGTRLLKIRSWFHSIPDHINCFLVPRISCWRWEQ